MHTGPLKQLPPFHWFGFIFVFSLFLRAAPSPALPDAIASQEWRVVRLADSEPDGIHFVASGFTVVRNGKAYVITNAHVLEKAKDPAKFFADFGPPVGAHPVTVLGKDLTADLALLGINVSGIAEERVGDPDVNSTIFIVGFDDEHLTRNQLNIENGTIERVGFWDDEKHVFFLSNPSTERVAPAMLISGVTCRRGGSGSPVFGSQGEILGVVKAYADNGECLAIDSSSYLMLLQKYAK